MMHGMTDEQLKILYDLVIKPLKNQGAEVYLFGSRALGTHHPHSDVDLLFRLPGDKNVPLGTISKIKEAIEESRFPFIVDLVDETDLAASYRQNVKSQMKIL